MFGSKYLVAVASVLPFTIAQSIPQLPENDPFYQAPAGYQATAPGTVLRSRKIQASFLGAVPDPTDAYQLLYRTTAINGTAISSVTTVFKPSLSTVLQPNRFVSFDTAYDGAARSGICDPSYNYQLGSVQADIISDAEYLILQAYLLEGYVVSAPDYEGPDAAFAAGRLSGMGALDSMRATANFGKTLGFTTSKPAIGSYGYSGGAIANGWAASLKEKYAPELNVKGWAMGGTPANLTGTAQYIDGTAFAGFVPQAIVGLSAPSAYGAVLQPKIDSIETQFGKTELALSEQICGVENLVPFGFQRVQATTFQSEGNQLFYDPVVAGVLNQCIMGQRADETPRAPVYMFHALQDEVIPYKNATTLRDEWCGYGASVKFVTYSNGGHFGTEALGFYDAMQFLASAFKGTAGGPCTSTTKLDNTLDPVAFTAELEPVVVGLINDLAAAGPQDSNVRNNPAALKKA